jgi:hypothetical protein
MRNNENTKDRQQSDLSPRDSLKCAIAGEAAFATPLRHADVPEGTLRMKNTPTRGLRDSSSVLRLIFASIRG